MKAHFAVLLVISVLAGAGLAFGGYWIGSHYGADGTSTTAASALDDPQTGRKVLYWHDPMVPGHKFNKPGKSPFMDMQLVPVYAGEEVAEGGVKISPTLQQNLGIRFATVRREDTHDVFEVVGTTQFDERATEVVQSRVTGYIDMLYARAPMQHINRGDPIALLFVPDWIAPQEEYLVLMRSRNWTLAYAARQRMLAMSIPEWLIAQVDRTGRTQQHLILTSPATGVITELAVRNGAMVSPGMTIAKVAGLGKIWLVAEVPEALSGSARIGMRVEATPSADPNRKYSGKVREILPSVSNTTRTVQARLELDNRDGRLLPGMLMRVRLATARPASRLLVPTEAIITTGRRSVVLVAGENNSLLPAEITTGRDFGDDTEILSGLSEGQKVVASGQFLIDSEASLKSILPKFATRQSAHGAPVHRTTGKIEKVSPESMTISHDPIPELKWPAMTMDFAKPDPNAFLEIKAGQAVEFLFKETNDGYMLESVIPAGGRKN